MLQLAEVVTVRCPHQVVCVVLILCACVLHTHTHTHTRPPTHAHTHNTTHAHFIFSSPPLPTPTLTPHPPTRTHNHPFKKLKTDAIHPIKTWFFCVWFLLQDCVTSGRASKEMPLTQGTCELTARSAVSDTSGNFDCRLLLCSVMALNPPTHFPPSIHPKNKKGKETSTF